MKINTWLFVLLVWPIFLVVPQTLHSQSSSTVFMKALGSAGDDYASSIQPTSDGGFIVAGFTRGFGAGREDVLLLKIDASRGDVKQLV